MNHRPARLCAAVITILLLAPATATTAQPQRDWPLANEYLIQGRLADGALALTQRLEHAPDDQQARFGLGAVQFLQAVESLSQNLYRSGAMDTGPFQELPMLRTVMAANPEPEPLGPEELRQVIQQFLDQLTRAEATLAHVHADVQLPLQFGLIQLDLTGDGQPDASLWQLYARVTNAQVEEVVWADMPVDEAPEPANAQPDQHDAAQFIIDFDTADAYWLRGYCHVLMALAEVILAHDLTELVERTGHLAFARTRTPHTWLHAPREPPPHQMFDINLILDGIALIHLVNLPIIEPQRMRNALAHLEPRITQLRFRVL